LIENQNLINSHLAQLKSKLALDKVEATDEGTREKKFEKINQYLTSEYKLIRKYTLLFVLDFLSLPEIRQDIKMRLEHLLLKYFSEYFMGEGVWSLDEKVYFFGKFYQQKKVSNLWGHILHQLKKTNTDISGKLGKLSDNEDIQQELDIADYFTSEAFDVNTLSFGKINFFDLYENQKLSIDYGNNQKESITNTDLLTMPGNIFITAPGGSGKSMLAKYLLASHITK